MKKILKKISKLLNKMPNIKCEMILFLYPILSFYGTASFYSEQAIILNDVKDLILFAFAIVFSNYFFIQCSLFFRSELGFILYV